MFQARRCGKTYQLRKEFLRIIQSAAPTSYWIVKTPKRSWRVEKLDQEQYRLTTIDSKKIP